MYLFDLYYKNKVADLTTVTLFFFTIFLYFYWHDKNTMLNSNHNRNYELSSYIRTTDSISI